MQSKSPQYKAFVNNSRFSRHCKVLKSFSTVLFATSIVLLASVRAEKKNSYFPPTRGEWETIDPASAGWDPVKLEEFITALRKQRTSGILILLHGKILLEHYWSPEDFDEAGGKFSRRLHGSNAYGGTIEDVASVQKSIASLIVGIAQEKSLLSIEDPVHKYLGKGWSRASAEQETEITVRHLITMSSGLKDDLTFEAPAGTRWRYNTTAYAHSMHVAAAAAGMPTKELVEKWLIKPLGLTDSEWIYREGFEHANIKNSNVFGFATSNRDLARIGLMVLNQGRWKNQTILSDPKYLHDMSHPSQEMNPSYGYLWWLNGQSRIGAGDGLNSRKGPLIKEAPADLFAAQGALQRKLYIVPSMNLVVTRLGNQPPSKDFNNQFWKHLMAAAPKRAESLEQRDLN